jgi:cellulose synthase/poly-beta-1,6-N-acetylglucosamine synthase-like glycosyltransferase
MVIFLLRIIEKLLIIYFSVYFIVDIGLYIYALSVFRRKRKNHASIPDYSGHPVSVIVPAYNEQVSVVHCTRMLLELDYPDYEVIVVNDGSGDATLETLLQHFQLTKVEKDREQHIVTRSVRGTYASEDGRLVVMDKENGGKADSINAGINISNGKYICTIDADSILDSNALKEAVSPFIMHPGTLVTGGQLAAANDLVLVHNKIVSSKTPSNIWVLWQIIEYIKSFMISRIGLSRVNALLIMSGAFSLYKKEDLIKIGGFLTSINKHPYILQTIGPGRQTVCEDMEIVIRLWQYKRDNKIRSKAVFLPEPVCWTEVPDNGKNLFKQRSRWHQGLAETLKIHQNMILEPSYGMTGLVGLPYYLIFELLSPLVKVFTFLFIIASIALGIINYLWAILLLASVMLTTAIILSSTTAMIEHWSQQRHAVNRDALRYKTYKDWIWLIVAGIISEFSYSFYKVFAQITGMINFAKGKSNWNKFDRRGIKKI